MSAVVVWEQAPLATGQLPAAWVEVFILSAQQAVPLAVAILEQVALAKGQLPAAWVEVFILSPQQAGMFLSLAAWQGVRSSARTAATRLKRTTERMIRFISIIVWVNL